MIGIDRTTFFPTAQKVTKAMNLTIVPDQAPEQGSYYRSDHFSLAKVGVPAFSIKQGNDIIGKPAEWGAAKSKEYRDKHYHQASDEYDPSWDFGAAVQVGTPRVLARLGSGERDGEADVAAGRRVLRGDGEGAQYVVSPERSRAGQLQHAERARTRARRSPVGLRSVGANSPRAARVIDPGTTPARHCGRYENPRSRTPRSSRFPPRCRTEPLLRPHRFLRLGRSDGRR